MAFGRADGGGRWRASRDEPTSELRHQAPADWVPIANGAHRVKARTAVQRGSSHTQLSLLKSVASKEYTLVFLDRARAASRQSTMSHEVRP